MGSSGGSTNPTIIQTPNPTNVPLQDALTGQSTRQLGEAGPFSYFGSGNQLLPTANLGQTYLAGPNPTMFGNPTDPNAATGSFGQVGSYNPTGGSSSGSGGGSSGNNNIEGSSFGNILQSLSGLFGGASPQQTTNTPATHQAQSTSPSAAIPTGTGASTSTGTDRMAPSSQATATPSSSGSPFSTVGTPLTNSNTINPGQTLPNSQAGDNPVVAPQPSANQATRNSFLGSAETAPFYNMAGVAGNLGTASGAAVANASNFYQQELSGNLTAAEKASLQAGQQTASSNLAQGMNQVNEQYENNPFADSRVREQGNLMNQSANNLLTNASNMGIAQNQTAAGIASQPFTLTQNAANTGATAATDLFNMANTAYNAPYQLAEQTYSQIPISGSTILPSSSQSKGIL